MKRWTLGKVETVNQNIATPDVIAVNTAQLQNEIRRVVESHQTTIKALFAETVVTVEFKVNVNMQALRLLENTPIENGIVEMDVLPLANVDARWESNNILRLDRHGMMSVGMVNGHQDNIWMHLV